mmetsp:Transcript_146045/g.266100  ORF Transcript_146045/g.266100 Transcript_146045/m.266100 type:complete len:346 (-) Transcript_146045:3226-4263(-)
MPLEPCATSCLKIRERFSSGKEKPNSFVEYSCTSTRDKNPSSSASYFLKVVSLTLSKSGAAIAFVMLDLRCEARCKAFEVWREAVSPFTFKPSTTFSDSARSSSASNMVSVCAVANRSNAAHRASALSPARSTAATTRRAFDCSMEGSRGAASSCTASPATWASVASFCHSSRSLRVVSSAFFFRSARSASSIFARSCCSLNCRMYCSAYCSTLSASLFRTSFCSPQCSISVSMTFNSSSFSWSKLSGFASESLWRARRTARVACWWRFAIASSSARLASSSSLFFCSSDLILSSSAFLSFSSANLFSLASRVFSSRSRSISRRFSSSTLRLNSRLRCNSSSFFL